MDPEALDKWLAKVDRKLAKLQEDQDYWRGIRQAILTVRQAHKDLARLPDEQDLAPALSPVAPTDPASPPQRPGKGALSFRQGLLRVLRDAHGEPLPAAEIVRRAATLGAQTTARDPARIADLSLWTFRRDGEPVEKTAPRTWRWTGDVGTNGHRPSEATPEQSDFWPVASGETGADDATSDSRGSR